MELRRPFSHPFRAMQRVWIVLNDQNQDFQSDRRSVGVRAPNRTLSVGNVQVLEPCIGYSDRWPCPGTVYQSNAGELLNHGVELLGGDPNRSATSPAADNWGAAYRVLLLGCRLRALLERGQDGAACAGTISGRIRRKGSRLSGSY